MSDRGQDVQDAAYLLWAGEAGRSPKRVSELLLDRHGLDVPAVNIRQWVARSNWAQRIADDVSQTMPAMQRETAANLIMAANVASRELLAAAIRYGETGEYPRKEVLALLATALEYGGFKPGVITAVTDGPSDRRGIMAYLTDDEIAAISAGHPVQ